VLEREGERETLLLAARHLGDLPVELAVEPDPLGHLGGPRCDTVVSRVQLEHLTGVRLLRQRGRLQLPRRCAAGAWRGPRAGRVEPEHANRPGGRLPQPDAALQRRRLPAPLRPSSPKIVPGATAKPMPSTAARRPYTFTSPSTTIACSTLM